MISSRFFQGDLAGELVVTSSDHLPPFANFLCIFFCRASKKMPLLSVSYVFLRSVFDIFQKEFPFFIDSYYNCFIFYVVFLWDLKYMAITPHFKGTYSLFTLRTHDPCFPRILHNELQITLHNPFSKIKIHCSIAKLQTKVKERIFFHANSYLYFLETSSITVYQLS